MYLLGTTETCDHNLIGFRLPFRVFNSLATQIFSSHLSDMFSYTMAERVLKEIIQEIFKIFLNQDLD